jgi:hypothetical protein
MTPTTKKLLVATCLGLGLLAAACSGSSDTLNAAGKGQVQISMTTGSDATINSAGSAGLSTTGILAGAPAVTSGSHGHGPSLPDLASANVTFSKIQARTIDGTWVDVLIALPATVDMVAIRDGKTVELPAGLLPPGTYDALSVTITQVDIALVDGTLIAITPPAGGWTVEIATKRFEVVEGEATAVRLKFREDHSFKFVGGSIGFEPEFECHD